MLPDSYHTHMSQIVTIILYQIKEKRPWDFYRSKLLPIGSGVCVSGLLKSP